MKKSVMQEIAMIQIWSILFFGMTATVLSLTLWKLSVTKGDYRSTVGFMENTCIVILGIVVILTTALFFISHRIKRRIQMNINQLVIHNETASTNLNYQEFESVAQTNESILLEKRRHEHYLEQAHRRMETILESITDAFYTLDKSWTFTYANHAVGNVFPGMDAKKIVGRNIWTYCPKLAECELYDYLQRAAAEEIPVHFETQGQYSPERWFEFHAYPYDDGLAVYIRDVTERKASEEALANSRQSVIDIVESITDGFFAVDREWRYQFINKAGEKFLSGKAPANLIGKRMVDEFPEIIGTPVYQHYLFAMNERKPTVFVEQHSQETWLEVRVYPARDGILIFSSDITERMRMEQSLTAEKELLSTIIASIGEGVIAAGTEGQILMMNKVAETLTGWGMKEALNAPINNVLYVMNDKTSEPYEHLIEDALLAQAPIVLEHVILATRELHEKSISLCCTPMINPVNQRKLGAIFIIEDTTEKERTQQELLKAEKLESLGILAGGIAHDFNNYLAAVLSNIELAQILNSHGQTIDDKLCQAVQATKQASDLTRQLLTFSRGGAPIKQLASIGSLIKETAKFNLHGSKVKCVFSIPADLWATECDPGQISQVISNLVINAKQAMPKGGQLFIAAENLIIGENGPHDPGHYIKATFTDQGVGIHESIIDKIFDPFFTTKKDGNGLGLATSFSIIKQHGGFIDVESAPGRGTTFTVYLPALGNTQEAAPPDADETRLPGGGKILLMDDEDSIREVMQETLHFLGFEVALAKDGHTALELYEEALKSGKPFDVVILDLTVPGGMGGQETLAYLMDLNPAIKAIVSSGYANDPVIAEYERYGFRGVVYKPYKINELTEVIQELMGRK
ncbi:MAG TPA: PAS domain-containing protein [Bacillota bacterium]|nr:PAS domain-containing protein [Bacillota bacterium]